MGDKELSVIRAEVNEFIEKLRKKLSRANIEIFVGGSYAKGTMVNSKIKDVDIFVRFSKIDEKALKLLESALEEICKSDNLKIEIVHGSRNYYRIIKNDFVFEIVPILKIKKPQDSENVTDLSYFHVKYIKSRIDKKIANEISIAKTFCKAIEVYGAESYIRGFSGYALECLLIHYKSFIKMLNGLAYAEEKEVIDVEKAYRSKKEALLNINESRQQSPIVVVDPVWKERNVTAALSNESFKTFQVAARKFLKSPSKKFFEHNVFNADEFRVNAEKKGNQYICIELMTDKQAGDIAGTKLKKFSEFLKTKVEEYFDIQNEKFVYNDKKTAYLHLSVKPKKSILRKGPPTKMQDECAIFRSKYNKIFEQNGRLNAFVPGYLNIKAFVKDFEEKYSKTIREMDIIGIS
jgi:tRNA nucleotidyltransferase (CCA-adding enzyme)